MGSRDVARRMIRRVTLAVLASATLGCLSHDPAALHSIPMRIVSSMRHLDGIEAQARYGIGHAAGAILVESIDAARTRAPQADIRRTPRGEQLAVARIQ